MAEQAQARMLSAAFPTPPPFYKHFTKQNVSKLRELRKEAAKNNSEEQDESNRSEVDVLSLPSELQFLVPPEPPATGRSRSFGAELDVSAMLACGMNMSADDTVARTTKPIARGGGDPTTLPGRSRRR
jgi:mediator of RNA polymerase II transcription subunit 7